MHAFGKQSARTHDVVYAPELVAAVAVADADERVDADEVTRNLLVDVFGFPAREMGKYDVARAELKACDEAHGPRDRRDSRAVGDLKRSLHEFVTGNESVVDQMQWERASRAEVVKDSSGEKVVEASLLPLVRDFSAHVATPSLIGSDFLQNYPDFFYELRTFELGFWLLAAGLPRWTPIPSLTRAHIARRNLIRMLSAFHMAMEKEVDGEDPGPDWQYLESVHELVKARLVVYRKHGFSITARAAMELALLKAANTDANKLNYWLVNRIYADKVLLELIREEIAPYAHVVRPKREFEFVEEPPVFDRWDVDGLVAKCPLLKSCYIECLRLDIASLSSWIIKRDFRLRADVKDGPAWSMKQGDYMHVAHSLHNTDPEYFNDPLLWRADRHSKISEKDSDGFGLAVADMRSARADGKSSCDFGPHQAAGSILDGGKDQALAFSQCIAFTAGLVAMWDIQPAGGISRQLPQHVQASDGSSANDNRRVWVRRRRLSQAAEGEMA
nr:cholesterol 7-alpha-monooxygenase [Quercus suber]